PGDREAVAGVVVPAGDAGLRALAGVAVRRRRLPVVQGRHVTGDDERLAGHRRPGLLHAQVPAGTLLLAVGVLGFVLEVRDDAVGAVGGERADDVARRRGEVLRLGLRR